MFEFAPITIDSKEVEKKIKGTNLKMPQVARKLMNAVNRQVVKEARNNFKANFNPKNHSWQYDNVYAGKIIPLISNIRYKNTKEPYVSYLGSYAYYSGWLEKGAEINAKREKYLTFKINGEWKKVSSVILYPKPFMDPAVQNYWYNGRAEQIMNEELNKILKEYWEG